MGRRRKADALASGFQLVYWTDAAEERAPVDSLDEAEVLARYLERNGLGTVDRVEAEDEVVAEWHSGAFVPVLDRIA